MGRFVGPLVVFIVGLVAWWAIAPRIGDDTLSTLLTWAGIIAVIVALAWAVVVATRRGRGGVGPRDPYT